MSKREAPINYESFGSDFFGGTLRFQVLGLLARRAEERPQQEFTRMDLVEDIRESGHRTAPSERFPVLDDLIRYGLISSEVERDHNRRYVYSLIPGEAQQQFWEGIRLIEAAAVKLVLVPEDS